MPVTSISQVTETIINQLIAGFTSAGLAPDIFWDSMAREQRQGVSFYLYHAKENIHFKNVPPPGKDKPPIKLNSLGLDLYYQLTAFHVDNANGNAAIHEQTMMSAALKILHDAPLLKVGEDKFRINLMPVPNTEAVHNWTAGNLPLSLSAYYEVTPIFLEPEKPTLYSGRVLLYGNYIFASMGPRITASSSVIEFILPGQVEVRRIIAQPGQAEGGAKMEFTGYGFGEGELTLRIAHFRFAEKVVADNWNLDITPDKLTVTVQDSAHLERDLTQSLEVLPGIYTAQAIVKKNFPLPGGGVKVISQVSNLFPFIVMPRVNAVLAAGVITINGFGFQTQAEFVAQKKELVEVYVGEHKFERTSAAVSENNGEFRVDSRITMEIRLHAGFSSGTYPLRIIVAGAESKPIWIVVP